MFKVIISDYTYHGIASTEEKKAETIRSNLYKLLKKQPVQALVVYMLLENNARKGVWGERIDYLSN